mgnify:FL=1
MLLQGVIDCLIETGDGFVILDFKTDRIKKGGADERAEQYRPQLAAYARAVHEIYGRPVRACVLYFFPYRRYRMGVARRDLTAFDRTAVKSVLRFICTH